MKTLPYIAIIVLLVIILLQNKSCVPEPPAPSKIDTVIVYETVRDTIEIKIPVLVASKPDTVWQDREEQTPDTTYNGLLKQYTDLGNRYFTTNTFQSRFQIANYGSVTVTDSIYGNWLMSSTLISDLKIPTTTITIEKDRPAKNQLYIGATFTGNATYPISGVYGGLLLKTKGDRIYGGSVGWTGEVTYGFSLYYKIKIRK
jgi:hypothetical protein